MMDNFHKKMYLIRKGVIVISKQKITSIIVLLLCAFMIIAPVLGYLVG